MTPSQWSTCDVVKRASCMGSRQICRVMSSCQRGPKSLRSVSCVSVSESWNVTKSVSNLIKWIGNTMKKLMAKDAVKCSLGIRRLRLFLASSNGERRHFITGTMEGFKQQHILFSHLYLSEGLVVAADVEQAVSLRKQPTKIEKKTVSTCNSAVIYIYIYIFSIFQLVTESRNVRWHLSPPFCLCTAWLKKRKTNQSRGEGLFKAIRTLQNNRECWVLGVNPK